MIKIALRFDQVHEYGQDATLPNRNAFKPSPNDEHQVGFLAKEPDSSSLSQSWQGKNLHFIKC